MQALGQKTTKTELYIGMLQYIVNILKSFLFV